MNKQDNPTLLILDDNPNNNDDYSGEYIKKNKKDKGKKLEQFEKFVPKNTNNKKNEQNLRGAENKLKSILSSFLRNFESEEKNEQEPKSSLLDTVQSTKKIKNNNNRLSLPKKKNVVDRRYSNVLHKKVELKKVSTLNSFNTNCIRGDSFQINAGEKKNEKTNIKSKKLNNKNQERSNYFMKTKNKKNSLIKDNNHDFNDSISVQSSIVINQSPNNKFLKRTRTNSIDYSTKQHLKALKNLNNLLSNSNSPILKNKDPNISVSKINFLRLEPENKQKSKFKNSLRITNNKKINLSKDEIDSSSIVSDNSKSILQKLTEYHNNQYENKFEEENFKNSSIMAKNRFKYSVDLSDINNYSDNKLKSSSIIHKSNISINKKESTILSKKSSIVNSGISNKNSVIGILKKKKVKPSGFKRAVTISCYDDSKFFNNNKNNNNNKKLLRVGTAIKSLQEQIKKTIILRPEDLDITLPESNSPLLKKQKTICNNNNNNNLKKSLIKIADKENLNETLKQISKKSIKPISNFPKKLSSEINTKSDEQNKISIIKNVQTEEAEIFQKNESEDDVEEDSNQFLSQNKLIQVHERYRIFIHRGQVYDSLDDEEVEDEVSNYIFIHPDNKFIFIFDTIILCTTIYSLFFIPFHLAHNLDFCKEEKFLIRAAFNLFIDFVNLLDLFLGFFRAYYNFEEQLIQKNSAIAKKYFEGWFLLDLICAIPFYSIFKFQEEKCNDFELSTTYYNNILNKLRYLYVCNRTLKILKIFYSNQTYNYLSNNENDDKPFFLFITLLIRFYAVLSAFHFCACIYIFISRNSYPNWILYAKLDNKSFINIYVCSIYMLITTLTSVGYGDITCYSFNERIFQLFLLIIGIMSYSYAVTCFSNYIKKINEKSVEFEKRKKILDDIKLNNPNIPDDLYDRILRHLKYKKINEKKNKNVILDCLPVGLKNNLIYEMYKPIIQNFIFFKNFQNTDFIVRVILSFRPVIAIKNDILVNEGDIIEDIMFVKRGVLTVELPINMKNPQENVDKYMNMTILKIEKGPGIEKVGNTTTIVNNNNFGINSSTMKKSFLPGATTMMKSLIKTKTEKKVKNENSYVKILNIRDNEHFGDVLMFLEQRSPLRVRVRSKKTELFFLKKTDAVNISSSYQNIWKRINKKSVFNFEQIVKAIHKIIELYCTFKDIKSSSKESGIIPKKRRTYKNSMITMKHKFNLEPETEIQKKKCNSQKDLTIKIKNIYFPEILNEKDTPLNRTKSQKQENKNLISNIKNDSYDSDSDSDSDSDDSNDNKSINKNKKTNTKLINAYNGNYKFYKGANKNYANAIDTIIDEEPGDEETLTPTKKNTIKNHFFNKTNSIDFYKKTSSIKQGCQKCPSFSIYMDKKNTKKKSETFKENIYDKEKCINEKEEFEEEEKKDNDDSSNSSSSSDKNEKNIKNKNFNNKNSDLSENVKKEKQKDDIKSENANKSDDIKNKKNSNRLISSKISSLSNNIKVVVNYNSDSEENENDTPNTKKEINEEIYPDEIFKISHKEENLFSRKINLTNILKNNNVNIQQNLIINNNNFNSQLESLINSNKNANSNQNNSIDSSINTCCQCKCHLNNNNYISPKQNIIKTNISIDHINEFEYKSLYENLNLISNNKYSTNKKLQQNIKNILIENSVLKSTMTSRTNSALQKNTTIKKYSRKHFISTIKPINKFKHTSSFMRNTSIHQYNNFKKTKPKKKDSVILTKRSETFSDIGDSNIIRLPTIDANREKKVFFETNINDSENNMAFGGLKFQKSLKKKNDSNLAGDNSNKNSGGNSKKKGDNSNVQNFFYGGIDKKSTMIINPEFFNKKKKGNLLSQINLNIQKTNQNLNNPDEFYSSYFKAILGNEQKTEARKSKRRASAICCSNNMLMPPLKNVKSLKKQKKKENKNY